MKSAEGTVPQANSAAAETAASTAQASLLDQVIKEGRLARDDEQRLIAKDLIGEFVSQVMDGEMKISPDTQAMINERIAEIDSLITDQLNAVLHDEVFQKLESAWRGLHYFVNETDDTPTIKIRALNASKKDLQKDLHPNNPFDKTGLFDKVYEQEFGMFGGFPFGALIGDYEFSRHPQDVGLLESISKIAAAAHAPFISAASPQLFDWDDFTQLSGPKDLTRIFNGPEYIKWKSFRKSEDSRYVGLCLPHILMRLPYGPDTDPVEGFNFKEDVDGKEHKKYLWGNAAYALGTRLTASFSRHNWCATIRGVQGGGLVEGLKVHTFKTDQGEIAPKCPTEIAISDWREKELSTLGFIPLLHCKGEDYAAFFSTQSCQEAVHYDTDSANANARLSTQLQYILATSRFAHYLKVIMRDRIGDFVTREQCEKDLKDWISKYVTTDDTATSEVKAQRPLREADVKVVDIPGKPGCYKAIALLRPHFQLDELTISLRLVAELPKQVK